MGTNGSVPLRSMNGRSREASVQEKFRAKSRAWARQPEILRSTHSVYLGDARRMAALSRPGSIHLVVTSPPYWNLKRYNDDCGGAQLGHIEERQRFLDELEKVWRRCYELLVPGGRMCVVVGDV